MLCYKQMKTRFILVKTCTVSETAINDNEFLDKIFIVLGDQEMFVVIEDRIACVSRLWRDFSKDH